MSTDEARLFELGSKKVSRSVLQWSSMVEGEGSSRETRVLGEACLGFDPVSERDRKKEEDGQEDRAPRGKPCKQLASCF